MINLTPYKEQIVLYNALIEAAGAIKANHIIEKQKLEYAAIMNSSNMETR